ncbi:MAG: methyltransferase domain-containing protein [Candidatus Hydrogenedens sp.]|nr:methyltransferase domain-containing protein [Candidatus Hydrogenedens sp.]
MSAPPPDSPAPGDAVQADWYASAFDTLYPILYAHRSVESARQEAAFAIEQLRLDERGVVLDLCCGGGRHLLHLAESCHELIGLDYSADLLSIAREHLPGRVQLVRGDMRALPFVGAFDAVANFFTSFGYFQDESENRAVLESLARALKPGGRFFMDYLNPDHLKNSLVPESEREHEGLCIREKRWIDSERLRVNKTTRVYEGDTLRSTASESVRLYSLDEMRSLTADAGLLVEGVYGDYSAVAFGPEHPRMILVGQRS